MYCGEPAWYKNFLLGCLKNDEIILGLIKTNPWHGKIPPIYVRSKLYSFEFSPPSKRVCFGIMGIKGNDKNKPWFSSEYIGLYSIRICHKYRNSSCHRDIKQLYFPTKYMLETLHKNISRNSLILF